MGSAHMAQLTRCPQPLAPLLLLDPHPSVEWTRWSSRWRQRASRRPRKGRPTTLPPSLHSHHPILPPCKTTHTCPASTGWGCTPPPQSHTRPTAHLSYPKTPGEGPGLSLAPPLTVWPANTGLHPHKPMQSTSLTMPFPDPPPQAQDGGEATNRQCGPGILAQVRVNRSGPRVARVVGRRRARLLFGVVLCLWCEHSPDLELLHPPPQAPSLGEGPNRRLRSGVWIQMP